VRAQFLAVTLLFAACTTPPLHISGRYASTLSEADIREIRLLAATRRDLGHTLKSLEVVQRNRVRVEVGHSTGPRAWLGNAFYVARRSGEWHIDEHSPIEATAERTITVY
jgi:hypothetical protein